MSGFDFRQLVLWAAAGFALAAPPQSYGGCQTSEQVIFTCNTTVGTRIEVCDQGAKIQLAYGLAGHRPDILLSVDRVDASTDQWRGFGRYISYRVYVPDGVATYGVFWQEDRLTETRDVTAWLSINDGQGATTQADCAFESLEENLEGVVLRDHSHAEPR